MPSDTIVHLAQPAIVLLFIAGRWLERREGVERVTVAQFAEVTSRQAEQKAAIDEKADCDRVTAIEQRLQGEHDARRRATDETTAALGRLQVEAAGVLARVARLEEDMREVRRRVFNGGVTRS